MNTTPYSGDSIKRGMAQFLVGKLFSALLNLTIIFWLVRLLVVEDYGVYVTLLAGMEFTLCITACGLPWVAARYLPEFRLHASGAQLKKFIRQVLFRVSILLIVGSLLLFIVMPWLLEQIKLTQYTDVARLYLLVLLIGGLARHIQDSLLGPLLQQGLIQISVVLRNLFFLLFLGIAAINGQVHLNQVVLAEIMASALSLTVALFGLIRYLHTHFDLQGREGWQPPSWRKMWQLGSQMYITDFIILAYGQETLIFLIQRFLGVESTALFGFLLNLYGQMCRYLPANLLLSLVRSKLVASYVTNNSIDDLACDANLTSKLNLFVLMPILIFIWLAGDGLVNTISAGKFTHSGLLLAGLLLGAIPLSQRQILETVAIVIGKSHLIVCGAIVAALTIPIAYGLLISGAGLWSPIIAMIVGQSLFNITLVFAIRLSSRYRQDAFGVLKIVTAAFLGIVCGFLLKIAYTDLFQLRVDGFIGFLQVDQIITTILRIQQIELFAGVWLNLAVIATFSLSFFLLVSYFFKPFQPKESMRLNRILKRNIFIW
jgi:O-antigen/teichoic acid export membrane protein